MGRWTTFKGFITGRGTIEKGFSETTTRPSIAQPYMATDTGAKLPIFPFPLKFPQFSSGIPANKKKLYRY